MQNILLATSGSKHARKAELHAMQLCHKNGAHLTILHVAEHDLTHYGEIDQLVTQSDKQDFKAHVQAQTDREHGELFARLRAEAATLKLTPTCMIRTDGVAKDIARVAREINADAIVLGGPKNWFAKYFGHAKAVRKQVSCRVIEI